VEQVEQVLQQVLQVHQELLIEVVAEAAVMVLELI
jgi:hypothetical protein